MSRSEILVSLFCGALGVGCVERNVGDSGDTGTAPGDTSEHSAAADSTGSPVPTTSTGGDGTGSSGDGTTGSSTMVGGSADTDALTSEGTSSEPEPDSCDAFAQDCPEGQKCAAWANDGSTSWNATRCVPVTGDQLPGEVCSVVGDGVSGEDDCIEGAMCWNLDLDNVGTCVALCTGSEQAPSCAEGFFCKVSGDAALNLCLPKCDPLAQDCASDEFCVLAGDRFVCELDASGAQGQAFDPCESADACDPGLLCATSSCASECDPAVPGCCTPMCSLSGMTPCPGVGQECSSVYEPGQAPPEYVDVGYCTIPT